MGINNPTQNHNFGQGFGAQNMSTLSQAGAGQFPNPFFDIASEYMPRDIRTLFSFCEFLYMSNGTFRAASRKVVRYFLTNVDLEGESDQERDEFQEFLAQDLRLMSQLAQIGDDYMCLQGDTIVDTEDGPVPIRELVGKTVSVLSKDGVYRPAVFKSYGVQELMEVTLSDNRRILATPEHRWFAKNLSGKEQWTTTEKMVPGYRIPRVMAASRPEQCDAYREGVRHGFVFGDGSTYNKHRKNQFCVANFFDHKDEAVMPYFEGFGHEPKPYQGGRLKKIHGLPAHYKTLPARDASAEYWYGFVCGLLAADGSVDKYGCTCLVQVSRSDVERIMDQLPRLGMAAGPICEYAHETTFTRENGDVYTHDGTYARVTLLKQSMVKEDFIIHHHRSNFVENTTSTNYGGHIGVKDIKRTGIREEVFCCEEPETHTFSIAGGILTGNCYGNCFISIYLPFDRYLRCETCSTYHAIGHIKYRFSTKDMSFTAHCGKCRADRRMSRYDRASRDKTRVNLVRWNPHSIQLRVHPISGKINYVLELDQWFVQKIREGNPFYINDTPWSIVECICNSTQSAGVTRFLFSDDAVYHLKESTLAGVPIRGWGIPPMLPNFKLAYYIQLMRRYDEAIALDFIMPFRVLHPPTGGNSERDPLQQINMKDFVSRMQQMVKRHRQNPMAVEVAPFPLGYQMLGGEATSLAPKESLAMANDELLNATGFPAELYKGTLQVNAMPAALRVFERDQSVLVDGFNGLIAWTLARIGRFFDWGEVTGKLRSVTLADDIERRMLVMQGSAGMEVSKSTAYRTMGIDFMDEQQKVVEEQREIQKLQQEAMDADQASQMEEGGAPGGPGGSPGATPGDIHEQARQLAHQLVVQTPETMRRGELLKIKHSNPTLHALVTQEMQTLRQQMSTEGRAMMIEQAKQGAAPLTHAKFAGKPLNELPSPGLLQDEITDQVLSGAMDRGYMIKLAHAVKAGRPGAAAAFRFVYRTYRGWDGPDGPDARDSGAST